MSRFARLRVGCLLLIASSLVAGVVGELSVRALGHKPFLVMADRTVFWDYDSTLGWHHRPGQHGLFIRASDRVEVRINDAGLRDRNYPYQGVDGQQRILVLGDSFTWGFSVAQEEVFTERMEAAWTDVEVINAGVSGYSNDQELLWLRNEGVKYRPDLVILQIAGNDDAMNHHRVAYFVYPKPRFELGLSGGLELRNVPVPRPSLARRLAYRGSRRSALVNLTIGRVTQVTRGWRKPKSPGQKEDHAGDPESARYALSVALIDEIRREAAALGAKLMIVATSMYWDSEGTFGDLLEALRQQGHDVLDVEATEGFDPQSMRLAGDGHWNSEGHAFVAKMVMEHIERHGLLDQPGEGAEES